MEYPYTRNTYWQVTAKDKPLRENRSQSKHRRPRDPVSNQIIIPESPCEGAHDLSGSFPYPVEPVAAQADANTPAAEEWATPTSQREGTPQQPTSGPEILATAQSQETVMVTENVTDVETTEPAPAEATPAQ
ncbi:hypothetical protein H105_00614 [Trichophyton soudanense CBS 452.61]|uniref:Uncharacterized protein n=1 Tax=Trichophyton soudanense CBS 452.61 TaxID=1215331 RepID=A0A022Y760_TRISD|nr:hypothetical protein H105_00614 [Trichophyton soudanense CBS 452.61]EZG10709.1 hypothetical protein H106_00510 [Trichophyton rubrum CBS 735.88]